MGLSSHAQVSAAKSARAKTKVGVLRSVQVVYAGLGLDTDASDDSDSSDDDVKVEHRDARPADDTDAVDTQ